MAFQYLFFQRLLVFERTSSMTNQLMEALWNSEDLFSESNMKKDEQN